VVFLHIQGHKQLRLREPSWHKCLDFHHFPSAAVSRNSLGPLGLASAGHSVDIQACLSVRCAASSFMTSEANIIDISNHTIIIQMGKRRDKTIRCISGTATVELLLQLKRLLPHNVFRWAQRCHARLRGENANALLRHNLKPQTGQAKGAYLSWHFLIRKASFELERFWWTLTVPFLIFGQRHYVRCIKELLPSTFFPHSNPLRENSKVKQAWACCCFL
jgi:hypothetical protein